MNAAARRLRPRKITSQPGPGVTIITTPTSNSVNPATIRKARRTCSTVRTIMADASEARYADGRDWALELVSRSRFATASDGIENITDMRLGCRRAKGGWNI